MPGERREERGLETDGQTRTPDTLLQPHGDIFGHISPLHIGWTELFLVEAGSRQATLTNIYFRCQEARQDKRERT